MTAHDDATSPIRDVNPADVDDARRDGLDPRAVEAAAEALDGLFYGTSSGARRAAIAALTAAAPFLRAEGAAAERQRIAADIRHLHLGCRDGDDLRHDAIDACADIAEADPGTTAPTEEDT